jgi:hypothetical protein
MEISEEETVKLFIDSIIELKFYERWFVLSFFALFPKLAKKRVIRLMELRK